MTFLEKIATSRNKTIKGNSQKWFNSDVFEKLEARDKRFKKF